jgi:DNA-binding CsgD family transcriptional regulator
MASMGQASAALSEALDEAQARLFLDFALASTRVGDEAALRALINGQVKALLPHGIFLGVLGQLTFEHLTIRHLVTCHYPDWASDMVAQPIHLRDRPLVRRWLSTREPVIACPVRQADMMSERERQEIQAIGLGRLAIHGVPDLTSRMGSYFSFGQVPEELSDHHLTLLLQLIVPLLHVALVRVAQRVPAPPAGAVQITSIEQQLLAWLAAGRSNEEMARLRERSPATIRNQLVSLYAKLGVATRAEAVAWALSQAQRVGAAPEPPA